MYYFFVTPQIYNSATLIHVMILRPNKWSIKIKRIPLIGIRLSKGIAADPGQITEPTKWAKWSSFAFI